MVLDDASVTLSPLPPVLSHGLIAVSIFGVLSFCCSTALFLFLTWKLFAWRLRATVRIPINQFLFLIYNLLFADIQQAIAFLLNISALSHDAIEVGTTTCFAQGWFVSTGDLASSVFICAIAIHTFFAVVKEYRLSTGTFYCCIAALWVFVYVMAALGPLMHGKLFYVRASAWCWIGDAYEDERLWLHYFWIFICMFSTVLIYASILIYLASRPRKTSNAAPLMVLYPLVYVVCTIPLAAGRISSLAGNMVSLEYFCAAGSMIACNGLLDVILYSTTRHSILFSDFQSEEVGLETFNFRPPFGKGRFGNTTTIEAGDRRGSSMGGRMGKSSGRESGESLENLYGLDRLGADQIGIKGEVTVSVDMLGPNEIEDSVKRKPGTVGSGSRSDRSGNS